MACSTRLSAKIIRMARAEDEFEEKKVAKPLKKGSLKDRKASAFQRLIGGKFKEREVMQKDAA